MTTPQATLTGTLSAQDIQTSSRLVWVLNRHRTEPYRAEFRGMEITIPANFEKIPRHVRDGGNLMEYLEACKFVRDFKVPQKWVPNPRTGQVEPIFSTKELFEEEMTAEEVKKILQKSTAELKKEVAAEERAARKVLTKELNKNPNKVALTTSEDDENR